MPEKTKVPALLRQVWDAIPSSNCKGLCQESCGPIGGNPIELRLLAERGVHIDDPFGALAAIAGGAEPETCPALKDGRCTVYDVRPTVCRLWGSIEDMPCPYGCVPTGGRLSSEDAAVLMETSLRAR